MEDNHVPHVHEMRCWHVGWYGTTTKEDRKLCIVTAHHEIGVTTNRAEMGHMPAKKDSRVLMAISIA